MSRGLTILLPTLNEVSALPNVVNALPIDILEYQGWSPNILVADGRSTDGTQEIASKLGLEIIVQGPAAGKGFGMREAFARFLDSDDEVLVMLDADGTYNPKEITRLLKHLTSGEYDVVIGSRLRGSIEPGAMSRFNWIGNHILTWTAVALYRIFVSDICTGYWAFKREAIEKMQLNSKSFEIEAEMFTSCANEGLRMGEVPISYAARIGESKLGSVGDGVKILRKLLVRRFFPRPVNRV
ncbi:MAG: glycosyltransferase family 2 protein [Candidatus Thalassarchaeaceae archaeon]|jgi:dolichol-phosphate mannosyltransferase|nr:glycosyltransferase family 2 protein [Candidatus Thalassarchaeaceae archaeon]